MSYNNPSQQISPMPFGLDRAIEDTREALEANLPWLSYAFGRGYNFSEEFNGKKINVPKVYVGSGEYLNVLPNDTLFIPQIAATSFFQVRSPETYSQFNAHEGSYKNCTVGVIFWANLQLINPAKPYIFTEELKADVETVLKGLQYVAEIDSWVDETAEVVFDKYNLADNTYYLMYPYAGFRVNVILAYPETCNDLPLSGYSANTGNEGDIDFVVGSTGYEIQDTNTYTNSLLIGKKIRLVRGHLKQTQVANSEGWVYSFNPVLGRITVTPNFTNEELISIEII